MTGSWPDSARGRVALFAVVFAAFSTGAVLSWESFGSTVGPAFFYPSAGITASAMMLSRRSAWPVAAAAIVAAELLVDTLYHNPPLLSVAFAAANVTEPMVGASVVLAWCGGRPDLRKRRDFLAFIVGACLTGPFAGSLIGGTASSIHGGFSWPLAVLNWWGGDALGVLVVAAPILLWSSQSYILRRRPWETAAVLLVTAGLSVTAFWSQVPPSMLILPVLAWAALRLDMLGAAIAGALAAFLANIMATRGRGLFSSFDATPAARVTLTQVFVATIVVVSMLIAQESAARQNALRQRDEESRERLRLESLSVLAQQLSAALTAQDIGQALVKQVLNDAGAKALSLGLISADRAVLHFVTLAGYPPAAVDEFGGDLALSTRTIATDVARSGKPIAVRTPAEYTERYPGMNRWLTLTGSESMAGWPLTSGGVSVGSLLLAWSEPQELDTAQLAYFSTVSTMVSQALTRAQIYTDERSRAAVLRAAVMPAVPVAVDGLEVGVTYRPAEVAEGVGGDWFDVMVLSDHRIYFAVGDIVGHGLTAVEDMAQLRSAGRAFAHQGQTCAGLLSELNRFAGSVSHGEFASLAVAVLDRRSGLLSYCTAGHPPPLLRRGDSGEVIRLADANGPVLGPVAEAGYGEGTVAVNAGDTLLMYTDGLVEHGDKPIEEGIAHLERIIGTSSPAALLDSERLAGRVAPSPSEDDVCLLVVRFGDVAAAIGEPAVSLAVREGA